MTRKLILFFLIAVPQLIFSQWTVYNTSNSSIPFNKIFALEIDKHNNVWCGNDNSGTFNHVTKFNGTSWTSSQPTNWVNDIDSDTSGNVWVITSGNELKSWNGSTWNTFTNALLTYPWADPLLCDKQGNKWIVNDTSLLKFDGSTWTAYYPANSGVPDNYINALAEDASQGIWIATQDSGLIHYNGTSTWTTYNTGNSLLPSNKITSLYMGINDTLWMISGNTITALKSGNFNTIITNTLLSSAGDLNIDSKGNFWMISNGSGALKYNRSVLTQYNTSNTPILGTNQLLSLDIDTADNVWIGTWGYGLVKYAQGLAGINATSDNMPNITVFPNPAQNELIITGIEKAELIKLYDSLGKEVVLYKNVQHVNQVKINITPLSAGTYGVVVISQNGAMSKKIVIE